MWLKQENTPQIMQTPLNIEYRNFDSLFYHTCINSFTIQSLQSKVEIKFLAPTILPFMKIHRRGTHRTVHSSTSQPLPENLPTNIAKKLFRKIGWSNA